MNTLVVYDWFSFGNTERSLAIASALGTQAVPVGQATTRRAQPDLAGGRPPRADCPPMTSPNCSTPSKIISGMRSRL
jgi:hypothetical protein